MARVKTKDGETGTESAMRLRACYAMSGTAVCQPGTDVYLRGLSEPIAWMGMAYAYRPTLLCCTAYRGMRIGLGEGEESTRGAGRQVTSLSPYASACYHPMPSQYRTSRSTVYALSPYAPAMSCPHAISVPCNDVMRWTAWGCSAAKVWYYCGYGPTQSWYKLRICCYTIVVLTFGMVLRKRGTECGMTLRQSKHSGRHSAASSEDNDGSVAQASALDPRH
eukprot:1196633-Rhodomonas_salina.1